MWDPFGAWLEAQHPDDVRGHGRRGEVTATEESIRLWEQRSREWVEVRLAAEQVATEFLQAFAAFDAEAAGAYLATGASTEHDSSIKTSLTTGRRSRLYRRWVTSRSSAPASSPVPRRRSCTCAARSRTTCWIRELGVGPFDQNYFTVTVDDASG